jgi:hypothetical protein
VTREHLSEMKRVSAPLLPQAAEPRITRLAGGFSSARAQGLDALLVIVPERVTPEQLAKLPEPARWQKLHARKKARAGTVRRTALANARQTLAVLGYCRPEASAF